jgi:hypothetical protein
VETPEPWVLEGELSGLISLPLNLTGNRQHTFCPALSAARRRAVAQAIALPIAEKGGSKRPRAI